MMHAPEAPLLPLRQLDNSQRRWQHLPRRDRSLAAFLVKLSDVLVNGIFGLNVLATTYFLSWGNPNPTQVLRFCIVSNIGWKAFVFGMPLAVYPFTLWISGMARSAEVDLRGLSTVSVWVFLETTWCLLLVALLTHCVSEASYIKVLLVSAGIIVLLMAMWGFTFNRPACFRCCCWNFCYRSWYCCCCLPPDIAAAEDRDQLVAAQELARQVARAQEALAAHVRFQEEASAAKEREIEAYNLHKKAKEDAETSRLSAVEAANALNAANDELAATTIAKEEAAKIKCEKQALATVAGTRARNAVAAQLEEADAVFAAETELAEATRVDSAAAADIVAAQGRVSEATDALKVAEDALTIANRKATDAHQNSAAATLAATVANEKENQVSNAARVVYEQLQVVRAVAQG